MASSPSPSPTTFYRYNNHPEANEPHSSLLHPMLKHPSNSALNVPNMNELYQDQFGAKSQALDKVLLFDFQEAFATRLFDSFLLTELPRVEVRHLTLEHAIPGIDALVYPLPEIKPDRSPLLSAINEAIKQMFEKASEPYPTNWFLKELERKYLENSFDNTLPVNKVIVIPFGPDPSLPSRFGLPSFLFGVSVWRPLPSYDKELGIKDALRAAFAKISAHNQKGRRLPLIRSVAIPTFYTGMVDALYGGDARIPAWQMAAAYLEYLTAKGVPKTPRNLARIDDTLLYLLDRGNISEDDSRFLLSSSLLHFLLFILSLLSPLLFLPF